VYVCGYTTSSGDAGQDGVLQKWTQDGQLLWSRTIGQEDSDEQFDAIDMRADAIYVCGTMDPEILPRLALTAGLDLEGNRLWSRSMIAPEGASLYDVLYRSAPELDPAICVCGSFHSGGDFDLLYIEYTETGARQACMIWEATGSDSAGYALSAVGGPSLTTYIAGDASGLGLLGKPGGAMMQLTHGSGFTLSGWDLLDQHLLVSLGDLSGQDFRSEAALLRFDSELALLSQATVLSSPTGSFAPERLFSYGQAGLGIVGSSTLGLPLEAESSISFSPANGSWTNITPSQGLPPLTTTNTSTSLTDIIGTAFNRQAEDADTGVYISGF
jgi:hypothetical protein